MAHNLPTHMSQWTCRPSKGFDGLTLGTAPLPSLRPDDCLVHISYVSLNYRDVAMCKGVYPSPTKDVLVPCSDSAGTVVAVGQDVGLFKVGDQVCPLFFQHFESGLLTQAQRTTSLGALNDGVLRQYAAFPQTGLVKAPASLSLMGASTLPCAALTAWNALFGLEGRRLQAGQTVLTQGTGGVSLFAIKFALAVGAQVIATTSNETKAAQLRKMGVRHVLNYKTDPNWGATAKVLGVGGTGVDHVIEVGGQKSMAESLKAVKPEGVISLIGFLGGKAGEEQCDFGDCLKTLCIVRGLSVGSRAQFEEMNAFIDARAMPVQLVVDKWVPTMLQAKEAFEYLWQQRHWGKVVISLDE